jgi:site-specific DNA-methyltransferase (adenine-specific)
MKPYYQAPDLRLYLGDALEVLAGLPEQSVDLIFADPPYNLSNGGFSCHSGVRVSVDKASWDKSRGIALDFELHDRWIDACRRVLQPNGSLWISGTYHSIYACGYALQRQGWHIVNDICWYKPNAAPNLSCRMFTASHETLIWARRDKAAKHVFNYDLMRKGDWEEDTLKRPGKQMRSVWSVPTPRKDEKRYGKHPTQKPEDLLDRIVLAASEPGAMVLDPFCGSATTGIAALRHGREFIGIDLERDYLDRMAIPRLEDQLKCSGRSLFQPVTEAEDRQSQPSVAESDLSAPA